MDDDLPPFENPFVVLETPHKGKGLFATRDIRAGECVIQEECTVWRDNHQNRLFSLRSLIQNFDQLPQPIKLQILDLHAWYDPRAVNTYRTLMTQAVVRPDGGAYSPTQVNLYTHLALVFRSNCFEIVEPSRAADGTDVPGKSGIFVNASRFNHSCDANVYWHLGMIPGYFIGIANRDIARDEELTIAYTTPRPPREERREDIRTLWGFLCQCEMCLGEDLVYDERLQEALELHRAAAEQDNAGGIEQYLVGQEEAEAEASQNGVEYDAGPQYDSVNDYGVEVMEVEQSNEDDYFMARLERRCEIVDELGWLPEQFFAHYEASLYYNLRVTRLRRDGEDDLWAADQAFSHADTAVEAVTQVWGPNHLMTAAAISFRQQMADALNPPEEEELILPGPLIEDDPQDEENIQYPVLTVFLKIQIPPIRLRLASRIPLPVFRILPVLLKMRETYNIRYKIRSIRYQVLTVFLKIQIPPIRLRLASRIPLPVFRILPVLLKMRETYNIRYKIRSIRYQVLTVFLKIHEDSSNSSLPGPAGPPA
ncbi:hypothetical protein Hte_003201 [Hypoxylon texense]